MSESDKKHTTKLGGYASEPRKPGSTTSVPGKIIQDGMPHGLAPMKHPTEGKNANTISSTKK